eukprot:CAMPEP_0113672324 /NCGR_PEP_ID=MMETSP0038_2-20120614/6197_1 /TAXON_ID=2898 /ORGANISM="Cryptomonas paramecium" /LENGTH=111 /DNA_ID=CAMNT_0000588575 /DNA_START=6 /DNA_END=338 /DNA_ORIENTATION=- /assembly_acc=CAM_ASM_000170
MNTLNVDQLQASKRDDPETIVIDIRIRSEFETGHVPGAFNIPAFVRTEEGEVQPVRDPFLRQVTKRFADKNERIYVCCSHGELSMDATRWMVGAGYRNAVNVQGGFTAWEA